jgi:hypothetical protein
MQNMKIHCILATALHNVAYANDRLEGLAPTADNPEWVGAYDAVVVAMSSLSAAEKRALETRATDLPGIAGKLAFAVACAEALGDLDCNWLMVASALEDLKLLL